MTSNVQKVANGICFADGTILDLVEDGKRRLAFWDGKVFSIVDELAKEGINYVPDQAECASKMIYLPRTARLDEDAGHLRKKVNEKFASLDQLSAEGAELLTQFVFASWFADVLPVAANVVLTGDSNEGLVHVLRLLSGCCRRPLLIGICNSRTFNKLPLWFQPTLLTCKLAGKEISQLLESTSQRCAGYFHGGELINVPIMIAMPMPSTDEPILGGLQVTLHPSRSPLPPEKYFDETREDLQPLLLGHRLSHLHRIREAASMQSRSAGPLGPTVDVLTLFSDNDQTRAILSDALKTQQEDLQLERESEPRFVVSEALLALCHDEGRTKALVGEIADLTTSISEKRNYPLKLTPRAIGHQLRRLGLRSERLGAVGRGLILNPSTRSQVHRLASDLDTPSAKVMRPGCRECDKCA